MAISLFKQEEITLGTTRVCYENTYVDFVVDENKYLKAHYQNGQVLNLPRRLAYLF